MDEFTPEHLMATNGKNNKRLQARIAGLSLHVYGDSNAIAANARAGLDARFIREALEIDPALRGEALKTKIELIKTLFFTKLALKSAQSRRKKNHRTKRNL